MKILKEYYDEILNIEQVTDLKEINEEKESIYEMKEE